MLKTCEITLIVGGIWAAKHNLSKSELPKHCLNQIFLTSTSAPLFTRQKDVVLSFSLLFSASPSIPNTGNKSSWFYIYPITSKIIKSRGTAVFSYLWRQWQKNKPQLEGKKVIDATSPLSFPVAWLKVRNKGDTLGDRVSRIITYAYGKCERCCFWSLKIDFNPTMFRT